ncbi:hypothetical protein F4553_002404 [Allocatelliglobosispora scoriae]|uniref:DUF5666 domain-containing protein n=1 Tax=Allocatelliglobosispora scoriae TaxID=643052 RepID=A0A841BMX6_9ACTN|nr:hypothetical protein [Allocatelliglobosispora scoriae]MBB5869025.1 hypothetical protein [Allocatelliglobosispora scoriae]
MIPNHAQSARRLLVAVPAAALLLAAASACGSPASPVAAAPTSAAATSAAPTPATGDAPRNGKLRGFGTVQELTDAADLIVRGAVVKVTEGRAAYRVDEVLFAAPGTTVRAGAEIALTRATPGVIDTVQMSTLEPGQATVLYLARGGDTQDDPTFATLSWDFGVFDVAGADGTSTATTRSKTMSVAGLRTADQAAYGNGFSTTLGELRTLAAERTAKA